MFITDQSYPVLTQEKGSQVTIVMRRGSGPASPIEPRAEMSGMFRYYADAATFIACQTRERWPVAMEGGYKALEAAYLKTQRQPGEELLVTLEGQVAVRPSADGARPTSTLVVDRYIGIWPGETCGAVLATSPLQETYWKLTRFEDTPVIVAENQRESNLVFRSQQNRVSGSGGCNNLTASYNLNGSEITFSGVPATQWCAYKEWTPRERFFQRSVESADGEFSAGISTFTTRAAKCWLDSSATVEIAQL
ncbi:MAG: Heat shock protein [Bryobacterales bacterium]|nr:Heat shock protein [Bryobacterales bacterium]